MSRSILVIEDNATLARNLATSLRQHGYGVTVAAQGTQGLAEAEANPPDVVLVDYNLPGINGLEVLRRLRSRQPEVRTIMITGHGSVEIAVEAMKSGACDYLSKPVALADVHHAVEKALGESAPPVARAPSRGPPAGSSLGSLLGDSPPMLTLKDALARLFEAEEALKDHDRPTVLITGETGTGKELVARAIHQGGARREGPFVELNCASLPVALVESELFGFERGAFTDARERKPGIVEMAQGGTLFLDEIGELDLSVQSKLLKLIEDRVTRRLGSVRDNRSHVRIIAATNQQLERQVALGHFRADLFFRLRIVHLHLPALRERGADILMLARHFLALHGERYGKTGLRLAPACERLLLDYPWPGNVRELRNCLEQAVLMAQTDEIQAEQVVLAPMAAFGVDEAPSSGMGVLPEQGVVLEEVEGTLMRQALMRTRWNVTRAAKLLGVSRDTLRYRIEKFELQPPDNLT
ncbi:MULTISPECIES: sigma-54-dependent transcriptional regulator [Ramlibacter]|uniref:Response regulator n=1 Tax=Ramlibacter pinisoli TaxID=2682844 RepID=A0A6N8IX10_9BURK|nr:MULTISPECIES: sigma-54 dependent transcriptional regulator [Ramlibacter]MBA2961364.1 sigma-54-dependent Fis family transcriptional regulator [Ramlibacter sp. CGMCC 1.13660]MVQ31308.1 response regulator [Ramlibacter pinisoli]